MAVTEGCTDAVDGADIWFLVSASYTTAMLLGWLTLKTLVILIKRWLRLEYENILDNTEAK
jgi:hypothetical protein